MRFAALLTASILASPLTALAQSNPAATNPFGDAIRSEVLQTMDQILRDRPDLFADAIQRDRENMKRDRSVLSAQALRIAQMEMLDEGNPAALGKLGSRTVLVLENLECAPCRALHAELNKRAGADLRVAYKVLPVARDEGTLPVRALHVAARQGKWRQMHQALHAANAPLNGEAIRAAAETAGLDMPNFPANVATAVVDLATARDLQAAALLGMQRVPVVVIESRQAGGQPQVLLAPSADDLRRALDEAPSPSVSQPANPPAQPVPQPRPAR